MALIKLTMSRPKLKGWPLVLVVGLALALLAVIDRGGLEAVTSPSGSCGLRVTASQLNVRSGPSDQSEQLQQLAKGATLDGTSTVTNGFRQLKDGRWVFDQYVSPMAGSSCS
jgi:hypothetical protein